jgi:4-hydroxy-tetrahydrodipicolinate reductase
MILKLLLHGCNGRMGQVISASCDKDPEMEIVAGVDINTAFSNPYRYPVYKTLDECSDSFDVIIDFSHPFAFDALLKYATCSRKAIVIATTGLNKDQIATLDSLSEHVPVFFSANMSLGINTLIALTLKACDILDANFDIEILDSHHSGKLDSPSGTALMIAENINLHKDNPYQFVFDRHTVRAPREKNEIGIHSVRGGSIVGDHTVYFAGKEEVIEITHRAQSRNVFAEGAITAAKFLYGKEPGLYSMKNLVGS